MLKIFRLLAMISVISCFFSGTAVYPQVFQGKGNNRQGNRGLNKKQQGNRRQSKAEQNIFDHFFRLDRNGNKVLEPQEINSIKRQQAKSRLQSFDDDSDGSITYQELVDVIIGRRKKAVEAVSAKVKEKLIEKISKSSNAREAEQNFSWLKSKKSLFSILDRNQDNIIDKSEINAAMPELLALVYSKRISILAKLINQSPSKQNDRRARLIARLMDYNADDHISTAEFNRFLSRHIEEEVVEQFAFKNMVSSSEKSEVAADRKNYIISSIRKEAGREGNAASPNVAKQPKPENKPLKMKIDKAGSRNAVKNAPKEENYIIPALKNFENEIEKDQDPLIYLLGAGANEELLW